MAANPIELNYQIDRNVACIRVSIDPATGAIAKVYNTSTQLFETYSASNDALYQINLTKAIPGYYRAVCPSGSLTTPATELFYDLRDDSVLSIATHAPSIGQGNSQGINIGTINGTQGSVGVNPTAVVDICNLALTHIGKKNITTLSDATEAARKCLQIYNNCRDEVLRDVEWKFATVIQELVENDDVTVVGWDFVYDMPSSSVFIRKIYGDDSSLFDVMISGSSLNPALIPTTNPDGVPYKMVYDVTEGINVLACNVNPVYIEFTVRIDDPAFYDSLFIKALSFKLASELAVPLGGDKAQSQEMAQKYLFVMSEAAKVNGNEVGVPRKRKSPTWEAR